MHKKVSFLSRKLNNVFRYIKIARFMHVFILLAFLSSLIGIKPISVMAAPPITPACSTGVYPCSIWGDGGVPANPHSNDGHAIDLGMKFSTDVDGYIQGIRFYKDAVVTGTHIGQLWSTSGVKLAEATFVESGTGWQEVLFETPVAVTAGTTYIASYYSSNGYYAYTPRAFGNGMDSGNLHIPKDGVAGPTSVYKYDCNCFPSEPPTGSNSANYWVDVIFYSDVIAVTSASPKNGFSGVDVNHSVTATFSQPVDPSTLASNFVLSQNGNLVTSTVTYDASTRTATLTPNSPLTYGVLHTATLKGGESGITSVSGVKMSTDYTWSFTTVKTPACTSGTYPCSIWGSEGTPVILDLTDPYGTLELGLKFKSAVNGVIEGIRFYKGPGDNGIHVGHLWTVGGTLLAGVTFTGETTSGWQEATFTSPVPITADTTYIVSYYSASGHYSVTRDYLRSAKISYPLQAQQNIDGTDPNGVFVYCNVTTGCFWQHNFNASNYWVDVIFNGAGDTTPPSVTANIPANNATKINTNTKITATFSEAMDSGAINETTFVLLDGATPIAATISYNASTYTATLQPTVSLDYNTTYTTKIVGGNNGVKDMADNPMANDYSWSFTTIESAPIPHPNMKAVVLVNSDSPDYLDFQHFIKPYLDNFGIPYDVSDIAVDPVGAEIADYALIIIGHRNINTGEVLDVGAQREITSAVQNGSGLVNFDNALSNSATPQYQFIQDLFGFTYDASSHSGSNVAFGSSHYITQRHSDDTAAISTDGMTLAGIAGASDATQLASSGGANNWFLSVSSEYRAVQFGSYDWMSVEVKGPLFGLDDLVWRSLVWAARKPFAMQGIPPFATFRVDDVSGPLDWVHIANEVGFKPWLGLFIDDFIANPDRIPELRGLIDSGDATASLHAFGMKRFFYFDQFGTFGNGAVNFPDNVIGENFRTATAWFQDNDISMSKFVLGHYYGTGSNIFGPLPGYPDSGLQNWGVEFIGVPHPPGSTNGVPWLQNGPYRRYESGSSGTLSIPHYYADYLSIPGHPELDGKFFNCFSEIRDIQGYDWLPTSSNLPGSIRTGTEWFTRNFDSMTLATLFLHEYARPNIVNSAQDWRTIMQGIADNIEPYHPRYVTLDYACQYLRATVTSNIVNGVYEPNYQPGQDRVKVDLTGKTDMPTQFYLFTEDGGSIRQTFVDVPVFDGAQQVLFNIPGVVDHIDITPNPASVITGTTQQFTATAKDAHGNPLNDPDLTFTWSIANGGGTIDSNGLFTAGSTAATFTDTVAATAHGKTGYATVTVTEPVLDHFTMDTIPSPQYAGTPIQLTISARDAFGNLVRSYNGPMDLQASTGILTPSTTGNFVNGRWSGTVTLDQVGTGITITASNTPGPLNVTSNSFDVNASPNCPCSIWPNRPTPTQLTFNDSNMVELGLKFRSDIPGYITGLRFYKGPQNTGTHTGHIWSTNGTTGDILGELTFTNESATGWQTAYFDTPIAIDASKTYLASYVAPNGYYSVDRPFFTASGVDTPPLHALKSGIEGPNSVFVYYPPLGPGGFLTETYQDSNYWVDVIFETSIDPNPNTAPQAVDDTYTITEDTTLTIAAPGVLGNDTDADNDALIAIKLSDPSHGALEFNADGSFTYIPTANYHGADSFTYKANDGIADSNAVTVSITVNAVNDAPVAGNDSYSTTEDLPLTVAAPGVLTNDTDVDSGALTAILISGPSHGTLTLNANGSFTYTPNTNYYGEDTFTYKANDGITNSNVASVTITVSAVNDIPVAVNNSYSTVKNQPLTVAAPGVLTNDTDVDSGTLTAILVSGPSHGTLTLNANGSFTYTPNTNYYGADSFTYKANDGTADSNTVTVSITVNAVNDAPVAVNNSYSTNENQPLTVTAPGVLTNDTDKDDDTLTAILISGPSHGTLTLNANGSFIYTPTADYHGTDSFTYKANDGTADSNVATVTITINAVNDAPVSVNDSYSTKENQPLTVTAPGVLTNDTDKDDDTLTAVLVSGPSHGTLTLNVNGSFTYAPTANYHGADSFTYKSNDGTANSNIATVSLTINAACYKLTTEVNPTGSGVINATTPNCEGGYLSGTLVELTAVPNAGYLFKDWSGDASGTTTLVKVMMDADRSVTANFKSKPILNGGPDTTGVFRPSNNALYLRNSNTTGFADVQINYGLPGDKPVVGDWDGDGDVTIGIYRNGSFYLRNSNTIGFAHIVIPFGIPGDQPVAGDWDGDGVDTIGVYRNGTFFLRNDNSSGAPDMIFALGIAGDVGIAGDWDGDGKDTTGVFRPSNGTLYLKNNNTTGIADIQINYGLPGDKPVTGDWDGDGDDTIGIYRDGAFYLRNSNTIGYADLVFALGIPGDHPIAGNWDGLP